VKANDHCSFCGKGKTEVRKLIAGGGPGVAANLALPPVFICDVCAAFCADACAEGATQGAATASEPDVIATRSLELRHEDGTSSPVVVCIARPRPESGSYRCDYLIGGLSKKRKFYAAGVDGVQALWLALVAVGVELRTSNEGKAGRIGFGGGPDLGLPPSEYLTRPEWHRIEIDGEELHWRRYPAWQRTSEETWVRCWTLEVTRRPDNPLSVGASYPAGTEVGEEHARALVRMCKEHNTPFH
jgi:hypothetical protein